jgi:hypothetical protein
VCAVSFILEGNAFPAHQTKANLHIVGVTYIANNILNMTTEEKKIPSWMRTGDSDEESLANQQQLNEEHIATHQEPMSLHVNNEAEVDHSVKRDFETNDVDDDSDDEDDETNRPSILPANLQVRESTRRGGGLFRRGRRNDAGSITTDHPLNENEETGSVASYMKSFSGNSVHSSATTSSILSVLSRILPFGLNKRASNDSKSEKETVKKTSRPPLPPKKPILAPSKRDTGTSKKSQRRPPALPPRPPQVQSTIATTQEQAPEATVHSSLPDPTPTYKSISTMDTEECTFEGGVPAVIYCFIKVNPYENEDMEDDYNNSGGIRSLLPNAIAKRLPKRKQPKTFIDEDDEESYFQTLVAL